MERERERVKEKMEETEADYFNKRKT